VQRSAGHISIKDDIAKQGLIICLIADVYRQKQVSGRSVLGSHGFQVVSMEADIILPVKPRMIVVSHFAANLGTGCAYVEFCRVDREKRRTDIQLGGKAVSKRRVLQVADLTAVVCDVADIATARRIKMKVNLQAVKVGIKRDRLVVDVSFTTGKKSVSHGEVEHTGFTAGTLRSRLRKVALSLGVDVKMHDGMVKHKFPKRESAMEQRLQVQANRQFIQLKERRAARRFRTMHRNTVKNGGESRGGEGKFLNFCASTCRLVRRLHDFAQGILLESFSSQKKISASKKD